MTDLVLKGAEWLERKVDALEAEKVALKGHIRELLGAGHALSERFFDMSHWNETTPEWDAVENAARAALGEGKEGEGKG